MDIHNLSSGARTALHTYVERVMDCAGSIKSVPVKSDIFLNFVSYGSIVEGPSGTLSNDDIATGKSNKDVQFGCATQRVFADGCFRPTQLIGFRILMVEKAGFNIGVARYLHGFICNAQGLPVTQTSLNLHSTLM